MLDFHPLTIADREAMQAVSLHAGRCNCNYTFANLVGWEFWFRTQVCVLEDSVVLRFGWEGSHAYMVCIPGPLSEELIDALHADAGGPFSIQGLEDDQVEALSALTPRLSIHIEPRRNQYDYLYLRSDLVELSGGKLKAKRNHVNRFLSLYPDFIYRPLEPSMFDECRRLEALWRKERGDRNPVYGDTISAEQRVMETVFSHWDELGMTGGSIYLGGRMVAFTYGAPVTTDTFDICVEKADRDIDGLFPVINQQFAARLPEQYVYVNREEDMGIEGLRKSKLSYHPITLLSYNAVHFA